MTKLIVIDNTPIWEAAFSQLRDHLARIDLLEDQIARFPEDQHQFDLWCATNFRFQNSELSALNRQLLELEVLRDQAQLIYEFEQISYADAYRKAQREEVTRSSGTPSERDSIDAARSERSIFVRNKEREQREAERVNTSSAGESGWQDPDLTRLARLTDSQLREELSDYDFALKKLQALHSEPSGVARSNFFLRIFYLLEVSSQEKVVRAFKKIGGNHLVNELFEMKMESEFAKRNFPFEEIVEPPPGSGENLRRAYYRLAKLLHPDRHAYDDQLTEWRAGLWVRAQQAHRRSDVKELEDLFVVYNLRIKNFRVLAFADIDRSFELLNREIRGLQSEVHLLSKSPAWGFSQKRGHSALKNKIERQIRKEQEVVRTKIRKLEAQKSLSEALLRDGQR